MVDAVVLSSPGRRLGSEIVTTLRIVTVACQKHATYFLQKVDIISGVWLRGCKEVSPPAARSV